MRRKVQEHWSKEIPKSYGVIQITMAHHRYWEFEITYIDESFLKSQANTCMMWVLKNASEEELWITEYNDEKAYDDPLHCVEWTAGPKDFDWRLLTGTNEQ